MVHRSLLACAGLVAAALIGLGVAPSVNGRHVDEKHSAQFQACGRACADCMRECESCARHCAHLVAEGQKDHLHTLGTCADCAEICAAAGRVVSRQGPMATLICDACAKACRDCATACRDMVQHGATTK